MRSKIALEEHFLCPGYEQYWATTVGGVAPDALQRITARLSDFGDSRIEAMDAAGIARAVLSLAGPGVQIEPDRAVAIKMAIRANDFLAKELQKRPDRYAGFGHLAMQDASAAADELERCIRDLGFCGVMINGHTNGQYLDHPSLAPFWERAAALRAPVYIHPGDPVSLSPVLDGYPALRRATWEWGFETGSHALRLVFGGVFARFPGARVILGHLGETLPYLLWRFDSRAKLYGVELPRPPSDYIRVQYRRDDIGHVLGRTLALRDCGARARARDVLERLPVRIGRGSRPLHGPGRAAGGCPSRRRLQQCQTNSEPVNNRP